MKYATFSSAFNQTHNTRNGSSIHIQKCAVREGKQFLKINRLTLEESRKFKSKATEDDTET